jgi:hypothetical protein
MNQASYLAVMPAALPFRNRTFRLRLSAYWLLIPLLACVSVIAAGLVYIASTYEGIAQWYRGLHACFYRNFDWQQAFFTPETYSNGKIYAGIAVGIAAIHAVWFGAMLRRKHSWKLDLQLRDGDHITIIVLWFFQAATWAYGITHCVPGYDEVFSAVNCAGMHPFQCASYYMLPNNHLFFNLLNSFASRLGSDPLLSARLISGLAAFALTPLLYLWIRTRRVNVVIAALICAVVLLQFPVWAFSFQGRGYALYLLCAWTSFISVQHYFESGNRAAFLPLVLATLIGFWTVPSYLYWEIAVVLYALCGMIRRKKLDGSLITSMLLSAALVFLAFTPVLCFSGLPALAENRYVVAHREELLHYLPAFWSSIGSTVQYTFNAWVEHRNWLYFLCFAVPFVAAPFLFRRRIFSSLFFLWLSWIVLFAFILYSKRYPYPRNQIAHVSIVLVSMLLVCQEFLARIPARPGTWRTLLFAGGCAILSLHFARFNREHIHDSIYHYFADTRYRSIHDAVLRLPAGAVVWVSPEGFYWEYLCKQRGLRASMCEGDHATHYIYIPNEEPVPPEIRDRYEKVDGADEYDILKIKR